MTAVQCNQLVTGSILALPNTLNAEARNNLSVAYNGNKSRDEGNKFTSENGQSMVTVKDKVVTVLNFVIKHCAMKIFGGVEVQRHISLTSTLGGGEWLASCSCRFNPGSIPIG
jgi:hypothetical protein